MPAPARTSAGFMLGQRCRRWARIGTALGQRLVFAGSVVKSHCVLNIAGCEYIKTVAPLIKSKDDSHVVTVDHLPGSKSCHSEAPGVANLAGGGGGDAKERVSHIKIHCLYCPQEPLNNINYKSH